MSERWRGVVAALLNPDLRAVLAEVMTTSELTDARRTRALARLVELGIVTMGDDGPAFHQAFVSDLLAEDAPVRPTGPARYLDGAGRIDRYPVHHQDRLELLRWVVDQSFQPGELLTESDTNERLARFTVDVAALRRHLVDAELLERTRSGSEYAVVASGL